MYDDEIPLGRAKDLRGKKFNKLTPLYRTFNYNNVTCWKCKCDCGKEVIVAASHLLNGNTKSCGCLNQERINERVNDLTGQTFNRLTVLYRNGSTNAGNAKWHCRCSCGKEIDVSGAHLLNGNTKSCGCLKEENINKMIKDLTGQTFNKLTVLYQNDPNTITKCKTSRWHCKCECGNEIDAGTSELIFGQKKSCGCIKSSCGEDKIKFLLNKSNIKFETQKIFTTCKDKRYLPFDFYINNYYLIEYDGSQHYYAQNSGWNTDEHLKITQKHDRIKNQWCKDNNIPLIRIPYTHLNNLCIEDLLLETSKFVV